MSRASGTGIAATRFKGDFYPQASTRILSKNAVCVRPIQITAMLSLSLVRVFFIRSSA
jgi:hypothetical protein